MVEAYVDQPVGYSIDVGYIDNKEELIEVNDGWSLGFYQWGTLKPEGYVKLITDRWLEIVGE